MLIQKILVLGNFSVHGYTPFWKGLKQFKNIGWNYRELDTRRDDAYYLTQSAINEFKPDIVMTCTYDPINKDWWDKLEGNFKRVLWYCDISFPECRPNNRYVYQPFDLVFITNREQLGFWSDLFKCPAYFMPQACLEQDWIEVPYKYDVIFVGQQGAHPIHKRRQKILDSIKHPIKYYPDDIPEENVYNNLAKVYRQSKISLGLSAFNDIDLYTSDRLFLAMGNCGFYLCEYFKGMEEMVEIGKHLDVFRSAEEADEKIDFYLNNEKSREKIRRNGWELAQSKHTYKQRIKSVSNILKGYEDTSDWKL